MPFVIQRQVQENVQKIQRMQREIQHMQEKLCKLFFIGSIMVMSFVLAKVVWLYST